MRCYIFCSAEIKDYSFLKNIDFSQNFVICADGGYKHAENLGITPDLWVGDSDSLVLDEKEIIAKEIMKFPVRKDNTDTDLAVETAIERGFMDIVLIGALGGRRDHEFSHLCLLKKILLRGGRGTILDAQNEITMENKSFSLYPNGKKYISFFPFGEDVQSFSVKGLRYEAENMPLKTDEVRASSNCFDDEAGRAEISFSNGYILVIRSND